MNAALPIITTTGIAIFVYLFDSLYARRWLTFSRQAVVYIAAAILIGVFGEVFVETLYTLVFGHPLWHYQVLPVHHTYTSQFSLILWTFYGLHLYWFNEALRRHHPQILTSRFKLATLFAFESLLLESFANLVWLLVFGKLIFYYTPPDLWHVTTVQNIPCYFAASWAMIGAVKRFRHDWKFFIVMSLLIVTVFLFFL